MALKSKNSVCEFPPMGWNSWDCYGTAVTEQQLIENAEFMAEKLLSYGWEYLVCDIQWAEPKAGTEGWDYRAFAPLCLDEYGRQLPAVNRFPSAQGGAGFKPIADKLHAMGLKFGIHIMRGVPRLAVHKQLPVKGTAVTCDMIAHANSICKWNTDMYGVDPDKKGAQEYYNSIFELYSQWGVDFVKVDDICNTNAYPDSPYSAEKEIELIRNAINCCGRDMVLSLSPGPAVIEKAWHLRQNANMWRITDDFWDSWELLKNMFTRCEIWQREVSTGCFPDCDMLPFGLLRITADGQGELSRFTHNEQKTVMNLWSIFRSPLIMGGCLSTCSAETLALLTNKRVLRLNKHSYGAEQVYRSEGSAAWKSFDTDGGLYLALFNLSDKDADIAVPEINFEVHNLQTTGADLWQPDTFYRLDTIKSLKLPAHGSVLMKLETKQNAFL